MSTLQCLAYIRSELDPEAAGDSDVRGGVFMVGGCKHSQTAPQRVGFMIMIYIKIVLVTLLCQVSSSESSHLNFVKRVLTDPNDPRNLYNHIYSSFNSRRNPRFAFFAEYNPVRHTSDLLTYNDKYHQEEVKDEKGIFPVMKETPRVMKNRRLHDPSDPR